MRCHTTARCPFIEHKHRVRGATGFERADFLKILTFKKQRHPVRFIQSRARHHRRSIDVRANPLVRLANFIEFDHRLITKCGLHLGFGNVQDAGRFRPGELGFGAG